MIRDLEDSEALHDSPSRALIYLGNLKHNLSRIQAQSPNTRLCLAVKANGYGHGAVACARAAEKVGVDCFGVAHVSEAYQLRQGGIESEILILGLIPPEAAEAAIQLTCTLTVCDQPSILLLAQAARSAKTPTRVHLKIDTGMGRLGCKPGEALDLAKLIVKSGLHLSGCFTHFPRSEELDRSYTGDQITRFIDLIQTIRAAGIDPGTIHASNSGGIALHPQASFGMIRPGIMAYGYPPGNEGFGHLDLKPVMELQTRISYIKEVPANTPISYGHRYKTSSPRWIATVPLGYGDGLPRRASGQLQFTADHSLGHSTPKVWHQVGTICMDQCMLDLGPSRSADGTSLPCPAQRWQTISVFGPPPVAESAASIAAAAQTIPYEVTCGISPRVPRVYKD